MKRILITFLILAMGGICFGQGTPVHPYIHSMWRDIIAEPNAHFQPAADSTTFFQVKNAAGDIVGNWDTTNKGLDVNGTIHGKGFYIDATGSSNPFPATVSSGYKGIFFNANQAAFRGGIIYGSDYWDDDVIGYMSFGFGQNVFADDYGVAIGYGAYAGYAGVSEGYQSKAGYRGVSIGYNAVQSGYGNDRTIVGSFNTINQWAYNSTLVGSKNTLSGSYSLGIGLYLSVASNILIGSGIDSTDKLEGAANTIGIGMKSNIPTITITAGALDTPGNIGFGLETAPETLIELTYAQPYQTFHNSTHEDSDGGRESRLNFKGEQSGGEETTLARIEVSHDGAADDQKGKITIGINDGDDNDTPTTVATIDSAGLEFVNSTIIYDVNSISADIGSFNTYGIHIIDSSGAGVTGTLADGTKTGQSVKFVCKVAGNDIDITIAHHVTSDPEVIRLDTAKEWVELVWDGTDWVETDGNGQTYP